MARLNDNGQITCIVTSQTLFAFTNKHIKMFKNFIKCIAKHKQIYVRGPNTKLQCLPKRTPKMLDLILEKCWQFLKIYINIL